MKKYYFIGIGGISMSALACLLQEFGEEVAGSDACANETVHNLLVRGIPVTIGADYTKVHDADIVVVSSAIPVDNEELVLATKLNKKIISRGELLGEISRRYENVIAVSGAHGKTTTTALIASIFRKLNPTVHIGGILCENNSNFILGDKKYFITEACEYKDNFLYLKPSLGVVLNVEAEHLDYFKSFEGVKMSFNRFINNCENCIVLSDDESLKLEFCAVNIVQDEKGLHFDCYHEGGYLGAVSCPVYGVHNVQNILTAIQVAVHYGISFKDIAEGLKAFKGVKRRFEKYNLGKGSLIFDYAHHPTEIEKSIATAKGFCKGELVVIFQPHTYSRTKALYSDFLTCLKKADKVVVFKTYSAREDYDYYGDAKRLAEGLACEYSEDYGVLDYLKHNIREDDVVLVLGAGDFYDKVDRNKLE